jgi:hypothetical protein
MWRRVGGQVFPDISTNRGSFILKVNERKVINPQDWNTTHFRNDDTPNDTAPEPRKPEL